MFELLKQKINKRRQTEQQENESFQAWLKLERLVENEIYFQDKSAVRILKILPINFKLKSELEQIAILNSYELFLKNLNSKIQIIVLSRKTDVSQHLDEIRKNTKENSQIHEMSEDYTYLIQNLVQAKNTITKEFYLIVPVNNNVENEVDKITEYLERCGNEVQRCTKEQSLNLLKNFTNKRVLNLAN